MGFSEDNIWPTKLGHFLTKILILLMEIHRHKKYRLLGISSLTKMQLDLKA
jgi:hypothetical protein